ncbi:MAG: GNAT family N-acetyltransferase [Clostridia bacterium]|nr:GNAT family N-acetyltransferase [Clostridia bacterium]
MEKQIRPATVEDAAAIGYVHYKSWQETYAGLVDPEFLASQTLERSVKNMEWAWKDICAAVYNGKIVGFCGCSAARDEDVGPTVGEVQGIYLLQEAQGIGLGRMLMEDALQRLRAAGYSEVILWVLKGNEKAIRFYEKAGFQPDGAEKTAVLGTPVTELRYRRRL